jgi:hypothetical protein
LALLRDANVRGRKGGEGEVKDFQGITMEKGTVAFDMYFSEFILLERLLDS